MYTTYIHTYLRAYVILTVTPSEDPIVSPWYGSSQLLHRYSHLIVTMHKVSLMFHHINTARLTLIEISETVTMKKLTKRYVVTSIIIHWYDTREKEEGKWTMVKRRGNG